MTRLARPQATNSLRAQFALSPPSVERRQLTAWILLAALVSLAAMAAPFFLGQVYVADDLGEFHLPVRDFYAQQLQRGAPWDWMPSLYGGFYLTGEGQVGGYHPLHQGLYRWLPLGAAFDLELLISYPLLFMGTFFFLKRWLANPAAACFGGLAFSLTGFNLLHFVHPNAVAIVAHIPWLLLAIEVALSATIRRQRAVAELAVGLLTASQLLLGYPQYVWFSLLIAAAYFAWRAYDVRPSASIIAAMAVAVLLGFCVAGIQLLPTYESLTASVRREPNAAMANSGSLHPLNLVQLVAPYLFTTRVVGQNTHELGIYVGAAPLLLCVWLMAQRQRWNEHRPLIRACLVFGVAALILAMGEYGGLYRLQSWIPLANRFRFPCRAIVLVQFCIAVVAAIAVRVMMDHDRSPREQSTHGPLLLAVLASVALAIVGPLIWSEHTAPALLVWTGPALVAIAAVLIALAARGTSGAVVALAVFTALDLSSYGVSYAVRRAADLHEYVAAAPAPSGSRNRRVVAPRLPSSPRVGDRMLLRNVQRVDGYAGLEPAKRLDYRTPLAMQLAGVGWIYHPATGTTADSEWTAVWPSAPRVRLVTRAVSDTRLPEAFSLATNVAAVEQRVERLGGKVGSAAMLVDEPGRMTIRVRAPSRQLLVTTESYHSGWQATIDGRDTPVMRINGDFLGCVVDPGSCQVQLQFRPRSLLYGMMLSSGGLGLMMCIFVARLCGVLSLPKRGERCNAQRSTRY
jgi:uncharacterized membrane protein